MGEGNLARPTASPSFSVGAWFAPFLPWIWRMNFQDPRFFFHMHGCMTDHFVAIPVLESFWDSILIHFVRCPAFKQHPFCISSPFLSGADVGTPYSIHIHFAIFPCVEAIGRGHFLTNAPSNPPSWIFTGGCSIKLIVYFVLASLP